MSLNVLKTILNEFNYSFLKVIAILIDVDNFYLKNRFLNCENKKKLIVIKIFNIS